MKIKVIDPSLNIKLTTLGEMKLIPTDDGSRVYEVDRELGKKLVEAGFAQQIDENEKVEA